MSHKFLTAFPALKLSDDDREMFEETDVVRLVSSSRHDKLHIYLESSYIIPKKNIVEMEKTIKKQYDSLGEVRIIETFNLSEQYTLKNLIRIYKASIIYDAYEHNPLWKELLSHADFEFPDDNTLCLVLEDRLICKDHEKDILDLLDYILNVRCRMACDITCSYKEREKRNSLERSKLHFEEEVRRITKTTSGEGDDFDIEEGDDMADESSYEQADGKGEAVSDKKTSQSTAAPREAVGKLSSNPEVIFGRDFNEESVPISSIDGDIGSVTIRGQVMLFEKVELRSGRIMVNFAVTDFTDTIGVKLFPKDYEQERLFESLSDGAFVIIKGETGIDKYDKELKISFVSGIKTTQNFTHGREDLEPVKRVELHCHTKMSDMDGVSSIKDIMTRAASWGHEALAITDHGNVQAFTDAFHALPKIREKYPDFKPIYGLEGYLVDDEMDLCVNPGQLTIDDTFVVFDLETTGFSPQNDRIIEIGAVKVKAGEVVDTFSTFVNPSIPIPHRIENLTGISDSMVLDAPFITEVLTKFESFCDGAPYVAHNASFDMSFLKQKQEDMGMVREYSYVDTVGLSRVLIPEISRFKLDNVAKALKVQLENHHRAVDDAMCTAHIFIKLCERLKEKNITTLSQVNELYRQSDEKIKKLPSFHVILLAQNETGRVNLYRLVSMSHLKYYHNRPRIPKTVLSQYREGIIVGSACEQGELYQAILNEKGEERIAKIAQYYDYLEIQPNGNNRFMVREEEYENIKSDDDLIAINKKIIELGKRFNKLVVATCDVHFLDPEDEVYRRILMAGKGFKDADMQAPLYLRTTEEMLEEFSYLDYDTAYEIVVTNTRKIAESVEYIEPVRPDKCPPVIEDSDKTLREICYRRAHEVYGPDLPKPVSDRLERELNSIITNGFAVMYIIAQKLVWKSMEDGYLVGSRGSVGSSFVATMAGITEVNPLSPHYYCSECHYSDFDSDEVKKFAGMGGCDMPDKMCPKCGAKLKKDGFDIPFETFLGFKGDKEPDIDLNFSGDYQSKAHKYTEVIFGDGQTFRAGTIGTIADKTAYGYVKKYYEERGIEKRSCEIERISVGCTGVRRTTGQHPGGIIVLPHGEEIHSFTPIQHPANDTTTDIVTTHFDYHSIDHNLLKLDILGHDDPTMIRMLQDLTGLDPMTIPLDDPQVMSLFQNTQALNITPEDIGGTKLGSLGIPEFGTDFAMGMLIDTKPVRFSDLVRIAGLSHGTDVWLGNAETLIKEGKATISTAICTRDDIMVYLINMGLDPAMSFSIMENVRKGKVAGGKCKDWPGWKQEMIDHGVPDWYIWSCEKIQYMFPKAHAAAYVMMAWRIAYYKINYPLAYYSAFFSIRASAFDYETMCMGKEVLKDNLAKMKAKMDDSSVKTTAKDDNLLRDMRIVEEMYARGFDFVPIDVYKAGAHNCTIVGDRIMPSLDSIEGMGDKAAEAVVEAAKDGPFLSQDDFQDRTKVSKTIIETMVRLKILDGLPESNQLSLFDFA